MTPDLSIIVSFHCEGLHAHTTLVSIGRAIDKLTAAGFTFEAIFTLDRADALTREVVDGWRGFPAHRLELDAGDAARARNAGVAAASGDFVAIMDGDDLYMSNWLAEGLSFARAHPGRFAWRVEVSLHFERFGLIWFHRDLNAPFERLKLASHGCWSTPCILSRSLALETPYPPVDGRFPSEDWAWSIALADAGVTSCVVPGTAYAYRVKRKGSLFASYLNWPQTRQPTMFFRHLLEARIASDKKNPAPKDSAGSEYHLKS